MFYLPRTISLLSNANYSTGIILTDSSEKRKKIVTEKFQGLLETHMKKKVRKKGKIGGRR